VRTRIGEERLFEVFVDTSLAVCKERRPDGDFEGFEPPLEPAAIVHLDRMRLHDAVDQVLAALERAGQFDED
jgi:adenylylsulfate kinase-like enzyme